MVMKKSKHKTEFEMVHLMSVEVTFDENLNAQKLASYIKMEEDNPSVSAKFGAVRMTIGEEALMLNKSLWWPDQKEKQLPYSQLKDVYTFDNEPKKLCIDVANAQSVQRRLYLFKMKSAADAVHLTEVLQKHKMRASIYAKDNIYPVQYGDWSSGYYAEDDHGRSVSSAPGTTRLSRHQLVDRPSDDNVTPNNGRYERQQTELSERMGRTKMRNRREAGESYSEGPTPNPHFTPPYSTFVQIVLQGVDPTALSVERKGQGEVHVVTKDESGRSKDVLGDDKRSDRSLNYPEENVKLVLRPRSAAPQDPPPTKIVRAIRSSLQQETAPYYVTAYTHPTPNAEGSRIQDQNKFAANHDTNGPREGESYSGSGRHLLPIEKITTVSSAKQQQYRSVEDIDKGDVDQDAEVETSKFKQPDSREQDFRPSSKKMYFKLKPLGLAQLDEHGSHYSEVTYKR